MKATPIGGTIDLSTPPPAMNVEQYPDYYGDDQETLDKRAKPHNTWTHGFISTDDKIVVPIDIRTRKFHIESICACGRQFHFNASTLPMANSFPIELGKHKGEQYTN